MNKLFKGSTYTIEEFPKCREIKLTEKEKLDLINKSYEPYEKSDLWLYIVVFIIAIISMLICIFADSKINTTVNFKPSKVKRYNEYIYIEYENSDLEYNRPNRLPSKTVLIYEVMELPIETNGAKKTLLRHNLIKRKTSDQYKLQQNAWTDDEGFRRYEEFYMIALGTYYVDYIGQRFDILFEDGSLIRAVIGDVKWDDGTDAKRQYHLCDLSIVEFIIDESVFDPILFIDGDCSSLIGEGAVIEIRKIN
jgi:hypothetical protein